jgi:hypothetical protein
MDDIMKNTTYKSPKYANRALWSLRADFKIHTSINLDKNRIYWIESEDTIQDDQDVNYDSDHVDLKNGEWKATQKNNFWLLQGKGMTVEELIEKAHIDMDIWEISEIKVGNWNTTMKIRKPTNVDGIIMYNDSPTIITNELIKIKLRRIIPKTIETAFDNLLHRMDKYKIDYGKLKKPKVPDDPHLLEISMPDSHFGMLAWEKEAGENYDTEIASKLYVNAAMALIGRAFGYNIEEIVMPVGNDLFHANDSTGTTPKSKNRLDIDERLAKVFEIVTMAHIEIINTACTIAPVTIKWVKGNHDPESSWYLAKLLEAWFKDNPLVTVDASPTPRKHMVYGTNLIAWTHGDEEAHRDLAAIMAGEWPKDWAKTIYREWHLGHFHRKREMFSVIGDEVGAGVRIRVLPSLVAKDYWHTTKGYKSVRAAEAYLYSKKRGYSGHFSVNVFDNEINV